MIAIDWDYTALIGEIYNKLPLDVQLNILKENYPIGSYFHFKQPDSTDPVSRGEYKKYICQIIDHVPNTNNRNDSVGWYILRIRNMTPECINIRMGKLYEDIHPGFFVPHISLTRNKKLELLGI